MDPIRCFLAVVLIAGLHPAVCWAVPLSPTVLYLDQSSAGLLAYSEIFQSFQSTLRTEATSPISVYAENLDSAHFSGNEYDQALAAYIRQKYAKVQIGTIVAVGSAALQFALLLRSQNLQEVPIVFALVDTDTAANEIFPPGVTGNTIRLSLANSIIAARALVPHAKQMALVGDPLDSQPFRRHFKNALERFSSEYHFIDMSGLPVSEVRERVSKLPDDAVVLYTTINRDKGGMIVLPREALASIAKTANRPIVVDVETYLGFGSSGGFVVRPHLVGRQAAALLLRVINGEDPSGIPITTADVVRPIFDWQQLQRWNVSEASLPAGSEVRFRPPTVWEQYSKQIAVLALALLLQAGLILALVVERWRRHGMEVRSLRLLTELAQANRLATAGTLSASIAHEIRQPLAAIVNYGNAGLRWLTNQPANLDQAKSALRSIVTEGQRADQVINEVRALFKHDIGNRAALDINDLVREVLALARHELRGHGVAVETTLCDDPPPHIFADRIQLQQLLLNLIRNAIDSMVSQPNVTRRLKLTTAYAEPDQVQITVEDSGSGIDPTQIDKIFDAFFTTKPNGAGMGLSICRSIVEAHGGTLTAKPAKGRGAVFEIALPTRVPEEDK